MKKTIADYPNLIKEWHPTKNGSLKPFDVASQSHKKFWWQCNKGHEWETICGHRTKEKKATGCPYCTNQKVCDDNCLATLFPEIAEEWHPTKNGILTPNDLVAGSATKIWWQCNKGHEWKAGVVTRMRGAICPYCANQKVCNDNCLAILFPEIAEEWHPTKNGKTPYDLVAGSATKIWWQCNKGHEWKASAVARIRGTGCPFCIGKKVCKDNCLATLFPEVVKEWHPIKNGSLNPNDITAGSGKKCWWICNKGHEWITNCCNRTKEKKATGCPYCSNQRVCKENCLATLFPELVKEWHSTLNGILTPNDVVAGSVTKAWWQCDKSHEWEATCNSRTSNKNGCPVCGESKGEKEVARILEKLNIKYKREYKFNSCRSKNPLPFDFVIWSNSKIKIIEYHGIQHYEPASYGSKTICKFDRLKKIQQRDKIKKEWCVGNDIPFLEISYKEYFKIEEILKTFLLF